MELWKVLCVWVSTVVCCVGAIMNVQCHIAGECVLALKSMFAIKPQKFYSALTHFGEETGLIR